MRETIEAKYREGQKVLAVYEQRMKALEEREKDKEKKRRAKMWSEGFWIVIVVLVLGGLGIFGYTQKDVAAAYLRDKVAGALAAPVAAVPNVVNTQAVSCENITVTDASKSGDGKTHISPVTIGKCYNIAEADREVWKKIFSDGNRVDSYANHIVSESADKSMTQADVVNAIGDSNKTFVLNLRKNAPTAVPSTEVPPTAIPPTAVPPTPTVAVPTAIPTPAAIVVPFPEKERQLSLAELASVMKKNNIPAVASNNNAKDFHDRVNWQVWYEVAGGKDYLVLNMLGNEIPPACSSATFISVTLETTGTAGEIATKAGDSKVWIVCK